MRKFYLFLSVWVAGFTVAYAQQESTLYTMRSLHQANYLNPALEPQQAFYLGLPGISSIALGVGSNSLNYSTAMTSTEGDDSSIDVTELRSKLKDKNYVTQTAEVDAFSLGFRLNTRVYLHYRLTAKMHNQLMATPGLLELFETDIESGAANFSIAPRMNHMTYYEHVFGGSYKLDRKLTLGANVKILGGYTNVHTEALELSVNSDPNNKLFEAAGNMLVYTSGEMLTEEGMDDYEPDVDNIRAATKENRGFAVDLGATYQLNNRLTLGMSLLNLGGISWKNEAVEYKVDKASFTFEGLDPDNLDGEEFEAFADSLEENFIPEENKVGKYRTPLAKKMYLTATYALHRNAFAHAVMFFEAYEGRLAPGFTAAISKDFGRRFGATLSYTAVNNTYTNVGAGISFRLTPFQLYVVSDNVLGAIQYEKAQHLNARLGLNFVIGTLKQPSKLPYAQK